jgi:hypothetical protein
VPFQVPSALAFRTWDLGTSSIRSLMSIYPNEMRPKIICTWFLGDRLIGWRSGLNSRPRDCDFVFAPPVLTCLKLSVTETEPDSESRTFKCHRMLMTLCDTDREHAGVLQYRHRFKLVLLYFWDSSATHWSRNWYPQSFQVNAKTPAEKKYVWTEV